MYDEKLIKEQEQDKKELEINRQEARALIKNATYIEFGTFEDGDGMKYIMFE
jgi:hypothetical protein